MARRRIVLWLVIAIAGYLFWHVGSRWRPGPSELTHQARASLDRGDITRAQKLIDQALVQRPVCAESLVAAGEIAQRRGDPVQAVAYYERVPPDGTAHALVGAGAAGDLLIRLNRLSDAERHFRRILAVDPQHVLANRRLAAILVIEGRRRESAEYLFRLVRQDACDVDELALFGNLDQIYDEHDALERCRLSVPDDPMPVLGLARVAILNRRGATALELVKPLVARCPNLRDPRIVLGDVLVSLGMLDEVLEWHSNLPPAFNDDADVWAIRGRIAELRGETDVAIRCYWESIRRDANLWQANYRLSVLLTARHYEGAAPFAERAKHLGVLVETLRKVLEHETTERLMTAARTMEVLGRFWEARNWYRLALKLDPDLAEAEEAYQRLKQRIDGELPQVAPSANPALRADLSSFPVPDWVPRRKIRSDQAGPRFASRPVRFADFAEEAGIRFTYDNGANRQKPGFRIWQTTGGGVGVLDYDGDGWPDLHFTQGGRISAAAGVLQPADQLYRNLGQGTFADVTDAAGVGDRGYSQGVATGDFDNDGFADLYIANIGRNRLFHNRGDGTFADVTETSGIRGGGWTASCLIADLNGDGWPDIYDATYLAGGDPLRRVCENAELHENRACSPTTFDGEPDRLYLNGGDGTFLDVTSASGVVAADSKSLGVVAADFEGRGRLHLFVANDTVANSYFVNETSFPGAPPRFAERALLAGCAYDAAGRGHANMGIAVGDVDGDGLLDLCVTAFLREYAVVYQQRPAGTFTDRSNEAGIREATTTVLGFGTQLIDADLDGWPDLVIANGHIDDYSKKGDPFRMRPQFFINGEQGRFLELPPHELGEYFERELLGRGLARLDWNRDGREDFAVSHLDSPAALVTNQTPRAGHYLAFQLRGVQSSRDAVGAVVRVTAAGRPRIRQVTAGDGYFASNQKQLIFGLDRADQIESVHVRWPSGIEQEFGPVPVDSEYLLCEGRPAPVPLSRP